MLKFANSYIPLSPKQENKTPKFPNNDVIKINVIRTFKGKGVNFWVVFNPKQHSQHKEQCIQIRSDYKSDLYSKHWSFIKKFEV
jgi:hypothetical protein